MIRAASSPSRDALTAAEGDSDYYATEIHYLSLANRIVAALRAGGSFVLVTGDPPAGPHLLSQALRKSTQSRHAVIDIACRADLTSEELSRARSVVAALLPSGDPTAALETSEPALPLFVFADVDQLSDQQIREVFEATGHGGQKDTAALLLARSAFLTRLEEPSLQFLKERLAAQFRFQEVGQDEDVEFHRHQLAARHTRGIPPGVLAIGGVLLTVGIGTLLFLQYHHLVGRPSARSDASTTSLWEAAGARSTPSEMPTVESAPIVANLPPIAAPPQTARLPQEALPHNAVDLREDHTIPRATSSAAAPDPGQPARAPELTLPAAALPSTWDAAEQQTPSPAVGPTATQSDRLPESTPPFAPPASDLQQTAPKAASRPASPPPAPPSTDQLLSSTEVAALVNRGDGFLGTGDIASARLFYERAADAGNGSAALRLGATFDPGFLSRAVIRGTPGDPVQAAFWYRRARDLGDAAAAERLKGLDQRAAEPGSSPR
jgi:hypothetical protein